MTRHEEREKLIQLLFDLDFHEPSEKEEQMELFRRIHMPNDKESFQNVKAKAEDILSKIGEIDVLLTKVSTGWPLKRLGKAELSIMRVATYEILYDDSVPGGAAINEAVEFGKAYGSDSAPSFINGVLAKLIKEPTSKDE